MIVLDASLVGPLCIPDEVADLDVELSTRLLSGSIVVPAHWHIEVSNMLSSAVRQKRLTSAEREEAFAGLRALPVAVDQESWRQAWSRVVILADQFDLTPYDAAYLELAERRDALLGARDGKLLRAARKLRLNVTEMRP